VPIDLPRLLLSRLLIQANSGAGKSWAIRRLLEQTHGQVPHVVLDIEDEFHTLREKFPYVLAGAAGADCRADVKTAPVLARRILEHGFSTIISIHELRAQDRLRFVRLFLDALIGAPRSLWRPLLVVVDEAHHFCPEKGQAESAGAVSDLMTRGRKRGYCGVLATQRISKLHKDAAAEANNKLIGRSALDLDMKRSADELGFVGREQQLALRTLPPGRFFAFGPALSRTVCELQVGAVQTTHPEPGDRGHHAPPPPPAKLKAILEKLADLPKDADQEADELQRLRGRVAELERAQRAAPGASKADLAAEYTRGHEDGFEAGRVAGKAIGFSEAVQKIEDPAEQLKRQAEALHKLLLAIKPSPEMPDEPERTVGNFPATVDRKRGVVTFNHPPPKGSIARITLPNFTPGHTGKVAASITVTAPQQRILDALAWLESVGITAGDKTQLALLSDASPKSSGYANNLGALRSAGLIEYPAGGQVGLTETGRAVARMPERPPTAADLQTTLEEKLPRPQFRILLVLIDVYPKDLDRAQLAEEAEQSASSSGFANNLGALRSLGFIDYPAPGRVVAKPVLFLEGK
jgi:hypothetical protein